MHKTILAATAVLTAGACLAQPPGITREMIQRSLPLEGAPQRQENADDMRSAIDWASKENARTGSPLKGKIATDKVAAMGTSCGGFLTIALGADPRVKTIGVLNSGVQQPPAGQAQGKAQGKASPQPTPEALTKLHQPVLLLNGGEPDFLMGASATTFDLIDKLPAFPAAAK